jgi:predicted MFS family arabinose efflux permease
VLSDPVRSVLQPAVLAAVTSSVGSVLPVYLVGAMAVQLRADVGVSASRLGAATLAYFLAGAAGSVRAGAIVERIGARHSLMAAGLASAVAMIGFALAARNWPLALAFLALGGLANSAAHPAANLMVAQVMPAEHRGLGFGFKQAAIPAATLLGGLFVPVFALTVGWRWGFAVGSLVALSGVFLVARRAAPVLRDRTANARRPGDVAIRPLIVMGLAAGMGSAAALSVGTFYVDSTVAAGIRPLWAGLLFAGGSVFGIATRIGLGARADRRPSRHLLRVSAMFVGGGVGFVLLAAGSWPALLLGTLLVCGAGSGWQGLFVHSLVRQSPDAPAFSTGLAQIMVSLGSALGPPLFGAVVDHHSYAWGWLVAAVLAGAGSLTLVIGRHMALSERDRRAGRAAIEATS